VTEPAEIELSLQGLSGRVVRRRWLIVVTFVAVFGAVVAWTFTATPRYASLAVLRIDGKSSAPSIGDQLSQLPGLGMAGLGRDEVETEIGILRSRRVADAAIDSLALTVRAFAPADDQRALFDVRMRDSTDAAGTVTFTRGSDGRYTATGEKLTGASLPTTPLGAGDTVRLGGAVLRLAPGLNAGGPATFTVRLWPRYQVRQRLDQRLVIRRQEGGSRLVEVEYEDPDRVIAAQVVSRIVNEFVRYSVTTEQGDQSSAQRELRGAIAQSALRLKDAEEALRRFQERERLLVPDEQATEQFKRIALLNARVDAISIERTALGKLLALIEQRSRGGREASAYRQLASFPSLISNRAIQDLLQAEIELETKRADLGVRRTEQNEEVKALTARLGELDQQLFRLGTQYLESLEQQLATTSRTVQSLTDTLDALPGSSMRFAQMVRARLLASEEYVQLQKQLHAAQLQELLRRDRVRLIDAPVVAHRDDRSYPKVGVQLALGAILALLLAGALGLLAELWSTASRVGTSGPPSPDRRG
jgi:uncharacterized protein involved in exopolysaccharide biosynthesis